MKNQYFGTRVSDQKKKTEQLLFDFLNDPQSSVMLMNEPVGFGKTQTLIKEALRKDHSGRYRKIVFLTYSNLKAEELENDLLLECEKIEDPPKIIRVFGESHIRNEKRYRRDGDIQYCPHKDLRELRIKRYQSAFSVCENNCQDNSKCPYYRTIKQIYGSSHGFDIVIGNLNEMQNGNFFFSEKFNLKNVDLIILDEDAIKKCQFSLKISEEMLIGFMDYLQCFYQKEILGKDELSLVEKKTYEERLDKIELFFIEQSGLPYTDNEILNENIISARGINPKFVSPEKSKEIILKYTAENAKAFYEHWNRFLWLALNSDSRVSIGKTNQSDEVQISFFPNLAAYREVLNPHLNGHRSKIVFTDATSTSEEMEARLGLKCEDLIISYDPKRDGVLIPKGRVFQVINNISKSSIFGNKELDLEKVEKLMSKIHRLSERLNFRSEDTWIIAFQDLIKSKEFKNICDRFNFRYHPDLYHGKTRGLNLIKDKDLIIIGSNFPPDKEQVKNQVIEMSNPVVYKYEDAFLKWKTSDKLEMPELESLSPRDVGAEYWMQGAARGFGKNSEKEGFGMFGRKVYVENIIQSMRSRFYWHNTKTLIFSTYPLSSFGIAAHEIINKFEFENI